ncbi:MAG: Ig-like domain-containing protein [Lachnospiraceae bacterium]|nr:Ig-like domain-containing protein [Lachnospiraceae bacterium]
MKQKRTSVILGTLVLIAAAILLPLPPRWFPTAVLTAQAAAKSPLNYTSKHILKGHSFELKVDTQKKVVFSSKSPSVASVSGRGKVKGKKAGTAVIVAKVGKKRYQCLVTVSDTVDLILFAGQSNMTGRGDAALAPTLTDGAGYECKVVTDANHLLPITEPFGKGQDSGTMRDGSYRTGSLVTAFTNAYYKQTKVPLVGVNATVVGSGRVSWSTIHYKEAARRLSKAKKSIERQKLKIGHVFVVYMQGENDGFAGSTAKEYTESLKLFYKNLSKKTDVDACLVIRIGKYTQQPSLYNPILKAQTKLCKEDKNFVLVSVKAASMSDSYYQQDGLHITQQGLNLIGAEAGKNAGKYARTGKQPSMKDEKYHNTYTPDRPKPDEKSEKDDPVKIDETTDTHVTVDTPLTVGSVEE